MSPQAPIIVFVRPQAEGNIGAIARVMANFNCSELRLVGVHPSQNPDTPQNVFKLEAWAMATKNGKKVLDQAKWYPTLSDALEGTHIAIGSSGKEDEFPGPYARPFCHPQDSFTQVKKEIQTSSKSLNWALVLGPEDDGLNTEESSLCRELIKIPTNTEASSLNVAMCLGFLLYHWSIITTTHTSTEDKVKAAPFLHPDQKSKLTSSEKGRWDPADHTHKEKLLSYLMEMLSLTDFHRYPDRKAVEARMRRWLQMSQIPVGELLFAFEILYHIKAWGTGSYEKRGFLK